jgi:hypothetical protein
LEGEHEEGFSMRHGRGCDCDDCYAGWTRAEHRRKGGGFCQHCQAMLPMGHAYDECQSCGLETGSVKWCDCGNEIVEDDGECTMAVAS